MTITYVGSGAPQTGNNVGLVPALPSGVQDGDLLLVVASIRNSGAGTVNPVTNWAKIAESGNLAVLARFYNSNVGNPTITFAGGVANADTIARAHAFRAVSPDALTQTVSAALLNSSAQNIGYPALDVPEDAYALLMALWKQDDITGITTPAGWTAAGGAISTTTGDDATQATFYQIQTTEADVSAGSVTVTGGAAAISRGLLLALKPAAAVTVNTQDVWPPRNQVVLTGLTIGDSVTVYRVVAGQRTEVRGAIDAATDTAAVFTDAELPYGVPVSYVAVVAGTAEYATGTVTYALTGGKFALTDAISGLAAEVVIGAEGDRTNGRDSARLRVGGRNVVVTGPAGQDEGSYELFVGTATAYENLVALLTNATEGVVQLRGPGGYDGFDAYLAVDGWTVRRWLQDGKKGERLVTIEFAETESWALELTARSFTYGDVQNAYPGFIYSAMQVNFPTYLDLVQGDFS